MRREAVGYESVVSVWEEAFVTMLLPERSEVQRGEQHRHSL